MRVIKQGHTGDDVEEWQYFLMGEQYYIVEGTGIFDEITHAATVDFQRKNGLKADGIVGKRSYKAAMFLGFEFHDYNPVKPDDSNNGGGNTTPVNDTSDMSGKNWPPEPDFRGPSPSEATQMFGKIKYKSDSRGRVTLLNNWEKENIITINIPQLNKIGQKWGHKNGDVQFHKAAAPQMIALWQAWEDAGLLPLVTDWCCTYSMRFVRGSKTRLSNHAYGTAFDINIRSNGLGKTPPVVGKPGSLRKLVPLANQYGFYWGGHFSRRKDGMHFEVAKILRMS